MILKLNCYLSLFLLLVAISTINAQNFTLSTGINYYKSGIGDMSGNAKYADISYNILPRLAVVARIGTANAANNNFIETNPNETTPVLSVDYNLDNFPFPYDAGLLDKGFNNEQLPNTDRYLSNYYDLNLRYSVIQKEWFELQVEAGGTFAQSELTYITLNRLEPLQIEGEEIFTRIPITYYLKYDELAWNAGINILFKPTKRFAFGINANTYVNNQTDIIAVGGKLAVRF